MRFNKTSMNLIIGCWNVRTLFDHDGRPERQTALVDKELERYDIDVVALSETRFHDSGQLTEKNYTFFWSGKPADEISQSGVGFAVKNHIANQLDEQPKPISDRIITMRLPLENNRFVTFVSIYAPTMTNEEHVKSEFYHQLQSVINETPITDKILLLGDFNARVGRDYNTWKKIIGRYGVDNLNSNGELLLSFCAENQLVITNTTFEQPTVHKVSWQHPRSKHWHLIDYIITRQRDLKDFRCSRSMRGADCHTDHALIRAKLSLSIEKKRHKSAVNRVKKFNVDNLLPEVELKLQQAIRNSLSKTTVPNGNNSQQAWDRLREATYSAMTATLEIQKRKNPDWFNENINSIQPLLNNKQKAFEKLLATY